MGNLGELFWNGPGYEALLKWRKQYGDIYTYWNGQTIHTFKSLVPNFTQYHSPPKRFPSFAGPQPVIAITGYESIKNTIVKDGDSYSDRVVFKDFMKAFRGFGSSIFVPLYTWMHSMNNLL